MSHETNNLKLEIPQPNVDAADLTIVSDNFEKVDAFAGDIATIETSPTTKAHSAGEFIIYEGRIYKVTSAISAGGSLVLGTNVSAANLGTELKSLRDSVNNIGVFYSSLASNFTVASNKVSLGMYNTIFRQGRFACIIASMIVGSQNVSDNEAILNIPSTCPVRSYAYVFGRCDSNGSVGTFLFDATGVVKTAGGTTMPANSVWRIGGMYPLELPS